MRTYAIGDVHGYLDELERAHALIAEDRGACGDTAAPVIHIGDLCDRGPDTKGVIDFLLAGLERGEAWTTLMGNHDRIMARFLEDPSWIDPRLPVGLHWLHPRMGGEATLASYGIQIEPDERLSHLHARVRATVPEAHRAFVFGLPTSFGLGDVLFVHAGIRPGVPLEDQAEEDLVWIREPFLSSQADHGRLVVHGHTPSEVVEHHGNRLGIDTGTGHGRPLVPVVIEGREVWALTAAGRVEVRPG